MKSLIFKMTLAKLWGKKVTSRSWLESKVKSNEPIDVNFTKLLRAAFTCTDPKSAKRYWQLNGIFTLLGSASIKVLTKQTCCLNWPQMSISSTFNEQLFQTKVYCAAFPFHYFAFVIFWWKNMGAKAVHKVLVKLTTDVNFSNILSKLLFQ